MARLNNRICTLLLCCGLFLTMPPLSAFADETGVVAVVNDNAITERDIDQRINLLRILQDSKADKLTRKQLLQQIVDDYVKIADAKRFNIVASDTDITGYISRLAKALKLSVDQLNTKLKDAGVSPEAFRRYISASITFNRIIGAKYREQVTVKPEDVDAKMAEIKSEFDSRIAQIKNSPAMKGVTVYELLQIDLPVEKSSEAMMAQLFQARAVEATQVMRQFKGCGNAKAAASGVFNVKIGKRIEADGAKLPPQLRAALDRAGPGKAVGPIPGKDGVQVIGFCGKNKIVPKIPEVNMPNREQVERMLTNDKFDGYEQEYLQSARLAVYVEYRDPAYAP